MAAITGQKHNKFKLFTAKAGKNNSIGGLAKTVETWVRKAKVAPKSIGAEFLESSHSIILSVGYREDQPAYDVKLSCVRVGKLETLDDQGLARLEKKVQTLAAKIPNVICHELYVTGENEFLMVFMSQR